MYFSDEMELLGSLNEDWTNLLKTIRRREEIYLQLLQNNKNIIEKSWRDEEEEDILDQTQAFQKILCQIAKENHQFQTIEKEIIEKYENHTTSYQGVIKLMSRVATNVLETAQSFLLKSIKLCKAIQDKLKRFKRTLVNMLNLKQKLNLEHFITLILDYSKEKMNVELLKFEKLSKTVESKEFHLLKEIYQPQEKPKVSSLQKIRSFRLQKKRQYSLSREDRQYVKKKKSLRKQKTGTLDYLNGIIQLSKHQWTDDPFSTLEEAKSKLFHDLIHRNRFNQNQINEHFSQEQEFQRKVAIFCQNPPKLSIQEREEEQNIETKIQEEQQPKTKTKSKQKVVPESKSSQLIQPQVQAVHIQNKSCIDNVQKKPKPSLAQTIMFHDFLATEAQNYTKYRNNENDQDNFVKKKMNSTRSKFPPHPSSSNRNQDDFPHIFNRTIHTQINESQGRFDKIKKEASYESKRKKLPQISRGTSFDHKHPVKRQANGHKSSIQDVNNIQEDLIRTNKRNERWFREDKMMSQRTKVMIKNVQVGMDLNSRRDQYLQRRQDSFGKEKKKTDINLMESTAYCKRTLTKFFDTKLNGF